MNQTVSLSTLATSGASTPLARRAVMMRSIAGLGLGIGLGGVASMRPQHTTAPLQALTPTSRAWPVHCPSAHADWSTFKSLYITQNGRVVDNGNRGVSHTESQGTGMLCAVAFNDQDTFARIHAWTKRSLQRPDGLHSWRYIDGQNYPVSDPNNATDGDIYIASALQQAGTRWSSEIYLQAARVIAEAILAKCTIVIGGKTLLLPGVDGFAKLAHVVVNPSYYAFPLMRQLNLAFPSPVWAQLEQSGVRMISEAKFGKWSLPSDWLQVRRADGVVSMAESFPQRFSYDALRIPLFLAWSGLAPDTTKAISRFWKDGCASEPSYADLKSGAVMGRYTLLGAKSIATLIASSDVERNSLAFEEIGQTDSYYSSSLHLLTRIAAEEIGLRA